MSEYAAIQLDNQFISVSKPKRKLESPTQPLVRYDYRSVLVNLRRPVKPSPEPKRYVDGFTALRPAARVRRPEPKVIVTTEQQPRVDSPLLINNIFSIEPDLKTKSHKLKRIKLPRLTKVQFAFVSLAILCLATGSYFSVIGYISTNAAKVQASTITKIANSAQKTPIKKTSVLSTKPISTYSLASYQVAPTLPRYIMIPKLGVDARVLSVGVTKTGALATPYNVFDTAWYNLSAKPGQPGAMLIDGHVSSWTAHGVFYGIKSLVGGDIIKIERGDGTIYTYKVVRDQVYPSGNVNMKAAVTPIVPGQPGLNLITCTGDVIPGTSKFNERVIVFATLVS